MRKKRCIGIKRKLLVLNVAGREMKDVMFSGKSNHGKRRPSNNNRLRV